MVQYVHVRMDEWMKTCLNPCYFSSYPVNTKHLYNIYTMLDQRAGVVQMLYK